MKTWIWNCQRCHDIWNPSLPVSRRVKNTRCQLWQAISPEPRGFRKFRSLYHWKEPPGKEQRLSRMCETQGENYECLSSNSAHLRKKGLRAHACDGWSNRDLLTYYLYLLFFFSCNISSRYESHLIYFGRVAIAKQIKAKNYKKIMRLFCKN